ncbi:acetyl-CoA carboxylase biotin carboxyl carrier protein [Paraburkholderia sacchari]|uniref:acetyl-CoA carboxylase biotin carboxyl carrier protein n=1 Tax=Paraburkholderia sacchari TaxID=159450 RepID=UPI001BD16B1D|nr:biotin/lipoyl-containing protein [Paraburkholderia sacchari]
MNIQDIERLVATMESSGLTRCVITDGDETLTLVRCTRAEDDDESRPHLASTKSLPDDMPISVRAPCSGNFRCAHPLQLEAAESEGSVVSEGQSLAYVQVESVLFPVTAPSAGRVVGPMLVPEGTLVGYGDRLMEISYTVE